MLNLPNPYSGMKFVNLTNLRACQKLASLVDAVVMFLEKLQFYSRLLFVCVLYRVLAGKYAQRLEY
jgi:hypothetical protein